MERATETQVAELSVIKILGVSKGFIKEECHREKEQQDAGHGSEQQEQALDTLNHLFFLVKVEKNAFR